MLNHLFNSYGAIDKIDLKEKTVKMMGPYHPTEPLAHLIEQLKKGREFTRSGGQKIADAMMVSKEITLLAHTSTFNEDIREWRGKTTDLKRWDGFKNFFHQAYLEQRRAVTTAGKGGYTAVVQNIYGVPPPPP